MFSFNNLFQSCVVDQCTSGGVMVHTSVCTSGGVPVVWLLLSYCNVATSVRCRRGGGGGWEYYYGSKRETRCLQVSRCSES